MEHRSLWVLAACLPAGLAGGCVTPSPHPPENLEQLVRHNPDGTRSLEPRTIALHNVQRVLSPSLSPEQRLASMRVVQTLAVDVPEAYDALVGILGDSTAPPALRKDVLAFLARRRQPGLGRYVVEALPQSTQPATRDAILTWLEENPSPPVLAELVKLWAGEAETTDMEEARYRRIVSKITAQPWDEALLGRLNEDESFPRGSALEVLSARLSPTVLRQRVAAMTARTPAVRAMQQMIRDFNVLPATRQELLAAVIAMSDGPVKLTEAAVLADQWRRRSGYRFNIRDLHLLGQLASDPLRDDKMSRRQLIREISREIARRCAGRDRPRERNGRLVDFDAQSTILSMADLWNLFLINEAFRHRSTRLALALAMQDDRADQTSRWGGLISYEHGRAAPKLYVPGSKRGDDRYVPSGRFLSDAMRSMCFFVGHFRQPVEPSAAGPEPAELTMAKRLNLCGVVLTSLAGDRINATYFTPRGVEVDMGEYNTR